MLVPDPAKALQPHVDLLQGLGVHGVEAVAAGRAHRGESALPQHTQVPGHSGPGDPELTRDDRGDLAGGLLALGEQFQDPAPDRVPQDVERVHRDILTP